MCVMPQAEKSKMHGGSEAEGPRSRVSHENQWSRVGKVGSSDA